MFVETPFPPLSKLRRSDIWYMSLLIGIKPLITRSLIKNLIKSEWPNSSRWTMIL
jgi:hypothetical protein